MLFLTLLSCQKLETDDFRAELTSVSCATYERCAVLWVYDNDIGACELEAEVLEGIIGDECLDYDPKAAGSCVSDWEALSCDALFEGETLETCEAACASDPVEASDTGA
jgi:hypothetical protein